MVKINKDLEFSSLPLIVLGSSIHDYPEHRKRLITECFFSGLAPVLVPPPLISRPESASCFQQLLAVSQGYIGFLVHCYRPRTRLYEEVSAYETEWRLVVERGTTRRFLLANQSEHPIDQELLTADPAGFPKAFELARRIEAEEPGLCRFRSMEALSEGLPSWLGNLRSELGLPPLRYSARRPARPEVFVSYARRDNQSDRKWLETLLPSLEALRNGPYKIPYWYDDRIESGELWEKQIFGHIDQARVAVLLVSRHFFASEYIMKKELPRILAAAEKKEIKVLPLLLEDCNWDLLGAFQFIGPRGGQNLVPLQTLSEAERNVVWKELERVIRSSFQSPSSAEEGDLIQPVADALIQICEEDTLARKFGLGTLSNFFGAPFGRTPAWAWPYLNWVQAELACLVKDQDDPSFAAEADRLLKELPTRRPVLLTTQSPVAEPTSPPDRGVVLPRYLDWVERTHKWLELPGIREIAAIPRIELDRVFVALRGDRATAHERLQSRRLLDLEVVQYARSLNQDPTARNLPDLRRQLLLIDEFMTLHREVVRQSGEQARSEQSITLGEAFRRDRWLVILGEPGSGKTTLIRWLAVQLAAAFQHSDQVRVERRKVDPAAPEDTTDVYLGPARLPVLVRVADYAEEKARRGPSYALHKYLGYHPWQGNRAPESILPPVQLNQLILELLALGQVVVLLDGMDEIAQSELRDMIRADIDTFIEWWINGRGDPQWIGRQDAYLIDGEPWNTGGNQIVITSRIVGYQVAPLQGPLTHVIIEPMAEQAVQAFCVSWSRAVHDAAFPEYPPEQRATWAAAEAAGLQAAVFDPDRPRIRELASNPLLITILALLYRRNDGRLPDQRVELYRTAIGVLIEDWPDGPINREELRAVLPDVAELIHRTTSTGLIEPGNLKQILAESLTRARRMAGHLRADQWIRSDSNDIQEFLDLALRRVGLMAGRGDLLLGFVHLTFQEYLAALWLVRDQDVTTTVERIQGLLDNPRWREPILLSLGHAGSHVGWPDAQFVQLLRALIEADAEVGEVLPRMVLLLAQGLEELPRVPDDLVRDMARQLLEALAAQSTATGAGPLQDEIDNALVRLREQRSLVVNEALVAALDQPSMAAIVAAIFRRREWWDATFAEPLLKALLRGLDQEALGWPILMALRDYATPPLPAAPPRKPAKPNPPRELEEWDGLQRRRDLIVSGARLQQVINEIDALVGTLPEAVAKDPAASDPDNPNSPARQLQRLHEERHRLESGEELQVLEERTAALKPEYENAVEAHDRAVRGYQEAIVEYETAAENYRQTLKSVQPQGQRLPGSLPLQQWLREEPRRLEELGKSPEWLPVFLALYGGVKDFRVGRFQMEYQKAVESFNEFRFTYENTLDDAIYQRAVELDSWQPAPARWQADLPFELAPEFIFRHSLLHAELTFRFDRAEPPASGGWLERLWSNPVREIRVEAALALFAAGGDINQLLVHGWKSVDPEEREAAATTVHALKGLLAGWRETLEFLLPKLLPQMLAMLEDFPPQEAEALRELLLANVRCIQDSKRRAKALWQLLLGTPASCIAEVWEEALEATWVVAQYLGYEDPIYACAVLLDSSETAAAKALSQRFSKETFNKLFADALCPAWAEHPDLFAEALHEHFARTPEPFNEYFQDRLLRGRESIPDICAAWFSVSGRYPLGVALDTCGVKIPESEEEFLAFTLEEIRALPPGRRARTMLRLAQYLPQFGRSPLDQALALANTVTDSSERLATYESILQAMPAGLEQTALADQAVDLVDHLSPGRPRIYSFLGLLPLVSTSRQPILVQRIVEEIAAIPELNERAVIIRQARRWALAEVQVEALIEASSNLLDLRYQQWVLGHLPPDLLGAYRRVAAKVTDHEAMMVAWTLSMLAGRAKDLLSGFGQQQDADFWTLLTTNDEAAIDRLCAVGEKVGLPLTLEAADAVEWMRANKRDDLLKLFLPLLERPVREVWPRLQRWLGAADPAITRHAALLIAEHGRQITPRTFPHLLALLEGDLDRLRLRAARILHGGVVDNKNDERALLASRLGTETLDLIGEALQVRYPVRVFPSLLGTSISAGRQRSSAKALHWIRHQLVFDDPAMVDAYLVRSAKTDPAATEVLSLLEACSGGVLRMLAERLSQEHPVATQQVLLAILSRLLTCNSVRYRMSPEKEDWASLTSYIPPWFARLPLSILREPVLLTNAEELVEAFIEAARPMLDGSQRYDLGAILRGCREIYGHLGDMKLAKSPETSIDLLGILGERHYYHKPKDKESACVAAEWIGKIPEVFPLLLEWLAVLLREDLNDPPLARVRQVLLEVVACYSEQQPSTVAAHALELNLLPLFCRVVTFSEHFRARADAILLVGALRKLTKEAAIALLSALRDVAEVQNAAQQAVDRFRYIDPDALELLIGEIRPDNDSATSIYGATRLLAGLAATESLTAVQRQAVLQCLSVVLRNPTVVRRGVYLLSGSGGKGEKEYRVRLECRLGEVLYEALLRVAGGTLRLRSPVKTR